MDTPTHNRFAYHFEPKTGWEAGWLYHQPSGMRRRFLWAPDLLHHGRRIMIGWMYHWGKTAPEGCPYAGALSIPRELRLEENAVYNYPEEEVRHLLKSASAYVRTEGNTLFLKTIAGEWTERQLPAINSVEILEDTKSVEVFVNGGEFSFTHWLV